MATVPWGLGWIVKEAKNNYHIALVREALSALDEGVRKCSSRISSAAASGCQDYADLVTDEECDVLETLIGSAFTVCQTHIAQVVADVKALHRLAGRGFEGRPPMQLRTTGPSKTKIMLHGCPLVPGTSVTVIEAINSLANYFKHRDEWPHDWTSAAGLTAETVRVITAVGLIQGSTGNLRCGAQTLGNPNFDNTNAFADLLEKWHQQVMTDYESELKSLGLLS